MHVLSLVSEKQPSVEGRPFMSSEILKIRHPRGGPFVRNDIRTVLQQLLLDSCHVELTSHVAI